MKNSSQPRPSDFTGAEMDGRHMRNSFRRLFSKSGPASFGYAAFGFEDIMFVDIGVYLHSGERALNRTLVIKDKDGKWYVHPDPTASPLLSDGLNEEKASVLDLTDVYEQEASAQ